MIRRFTVTLLNPNKILSVFADKTENHVLVTNSFHYKKQGLIFLKNQQLTNHGFLLLTTVLLKNFKSITIREDY